MRGPRGIGLLACVVLAGLSFGCGPSKKADEALCRAAATGDIEAVRRAISHGVSVEARNRDGISLLGYAAMGGQNAVIRYLVEQGASVNAIDHLRQPSTALMWACSCKQESAMATLLSLGADVNIHEASGITALHIASGRMSAKAVGALVEAGARVDVACESGDTPLMVAARTGNREVVEYLLSVGANPHLRDKKGMDAAAIAEEKKHRDVAEMIRQHMGKTSPQEEPSP